MKWLCQRNLLFSTGIDVNGIILNCSLLNCSSLKLFAEFTHFFILSFFLSIPGGFNSEESWSLFFEKRGISSNPFQDTFFTTWHDHNFNNIWPEVDTVKLSEKVRDCENKLKELGLFFLSDAYRASYQNSLAVW